MNSVHESTARPVRIAPRLRYRFFISLIVSAGLIFALAVPLLGSSPSSQAFKVAQAASDPVIVAAGDIACDPASSNFNGGNGTASLCRQKYTSDLMVNKGYAAVLALGDNQYYCGGYQAFLQSYDLSWGRVKSITHPAVGNHEYLTSGGTDCTVNNAGATGYFNYFGAAAGTPGQGYYSFDIGDWHIIALNSNCGDAGGCGSGSPQYAWLQADLAAHQNLCTLAYWHIPFFSSGGRAAANSKAFWQLLYNSNADLILNGHDHIYERFAPQDPTGTFDPIQGIRELIVGTGGSDHTSIAQIVPNSERRNISTYGVLELTLHSNSADWRFIPEAGKTFTDSGTTVCHGVSSDTTPPTAPANLYATTVSSSQVNLVWGASADNVGVTGYRILRNGVQIGVTSGTSYSDATVQPNITYDYSVVASDAGLNTSPSSNILSITTPPILTFSPIADTYVQSDVPTTNFGSAAQMAVDNSPVSHTLLKFSVSGVGTNSILSAKLRLYCLDGSPIGGEFHRVTDNSWDESIVDWNTAPPAQTSVLKTLGAVTAGSWYEVDVTSLITGDGTFSLMAISSSSDEAYYSTKEGTAGFAPQLIVSTSIKNPTLTPGPNATSTPRNTRTPTVTRTPTLSRTPTATRTINPTRTPTIAPTLDTVGVFRPSNGALYLKNSNVSGSADIAINYGLPGDYPVVGDWDGNGTATIGVYRNGVFYLRNSNTIGFANLTIAFGSPGDQPIAGDWNGDGIDTIGVYHSATGTFYLRNRNSAGTPNLTFSLGVPGDIAIAGDWNGDGVDTTGIFRPSTGALYLKNKNTTGFANIAINFGLPGDQPVTGDWNNDGVDTIGIYRNGIFYLRNSNTIGIANLVFALGNAGDMPIAGNWDGRP